MTVVYIRQLLTNEEGDFEGCHVELVISWHSRQCLSCLWVAMVALGLCLQQERGGYTWSSCWGIPLPELTALSLSLSLSLFCRVASGISFPPHVILLASQGFGAFLVPSVHKRVCSNSPQDTKFFPPHTPSPPFSYRWSCSCLVSSSCLDGCSTLAFFTFSTVHVISHMGCVGNKIGASNYVA